MMFLKFSKNKEYLEYLKKGSFYMKSGKFYIEQEKIHENRGIGDAFELHNIQHNVELTFIFGQEKHTTTAIKFSNTSQGGSGAKMFFV